MISPLDRNRSRAARASQEQVTAVPAMTSCSARRRSPSRMPGEPSPGNRKLNGSASVRTTARRPLAPVPSSRTTRTPTSAMPAVLPLAAQH